MDRDMGRNSEVERVRGKLRDRGTGIDTII